MKSFIEKATILLCFLAIVILGLVMLGKTNAPVLSSVGNGLVTFFNGLWIALIVIFVLAVLITLGAARVLLRRMGETHVIRDGKEGQATRAIVHKGELVQVAPSGVDANQMMQLQSQQAAHMKQFWQMFSAATSSMKGMAAFMDQYEVVDAEDEVEALGEGEETKQIAPPVTYHLIDQLHDQQTVPNEEESIVGYVDGQPLRGRLFSDDGNMFDSIFVAGDTGFGKSVFAVYFNALNVLHYGRTLVIDPDAEFDQSLSKRLGPLAHEMFLLHPVASTPEMAHKVIDMAEDELDVPGDYPVLWLVDEFSMIMRHAESNGKWGEVGKRLATVAEDWATRGRKRRRKVMVFGQMTQAKRTGGTELRDSMTTVCFHLKERRARLVLDVEEAEITPTLKPGEVLVIPARSSEDSYRMQIPLPDEEALQVIARTIASSGDDKNTRQSARTEPEPDLNATRTEPEPRCQIIEMTPELALKAKVRRVGELRKQGKNMSQIIEMLYGVSRGGSAEYAKARDEYLSIIKMITLEDAQEQGIEA